MSSRDRTPLLSIPKGTILLGAALFIAPPFPAQEQPSPAKQGSAEILRSFHTMYVRSETWLVKPEMLQADLQKHPEFDAWGLAIVNNQDADAIVKVDHQPGWFYYTYSMTNPNTGIVLLAGKVTAWDGKVACGKIAKDIIKRVKRVRPLPEGEKKKD